MRQAARSGLFAAAVLTAGLGRASHAAAPARIVWVDDELRVRRADAAAALAAGMPLGATGGEVKLAAFRGETVAFQVVIVAGDEAFGPASLAVSALSPAGATPSGAAPSGATAATGAPLRATVYSEHYLRVDRRSRNAREPDESLGWSPDARPPDAEMLGEVPDALLASAAAPLVPAGQTGAFWVDVAVPEGAPSGAYRGAASLALAGRSVARFDVALDVGPPALPYRATSVMLFYETTHLAKRFGAGAPAARAERQLWQLLHAHHIDALAQTGEPDDISRLAAAYDGSLFTAAQGYEGPGVGLPPAAVALGTYGALGAPTPASLATLDAMLARLPRGLAADLFLYAVDEQCGSPLPAAWEEALGGRPARGRVGVAATCDSAPARQTAEIAILTAGAYRRDTRAEAEAAHRRAWIYNGALPRTGTLLLDADPRGLTANGWIAAIADVERWFYWESTFWDDDGPGGHGPVDPFVTAETFHNRDGDSCLGDGLLLYPGREVGFPGARAPGVDAVLPSLRLKALRRGIEDAGLIALAAREHPAEAAAVVARALPTALDEAAADRRASWEEAPLRFGAARAALRTLVSRAAPPAGGELSQLFRTLGAARAAAIPSAPTAAALRHRRRATRAALACAALVAFAAAGAAVARRRRGKRRGAPGGPS